MNFGVGPSNFDTAQSIAAAINDTTNTLGFVTATAHSGLVVRESSDGLSASTGNQVLISAFQDGTQGNGITIETTNPIALVASGTETEGGTGVPCEGKTNTNWTVLGVNVYRSDTGERGPYFRVNRVPVMTNFYRDRTDVVETTGEVVQWDNAWIYRGSAPNVPDTWRFRVPVSYTHLTLPTICSV